MWGRSEGGQQKTKGEGKGSPPPPPPPPPLPLPPPPPPSSSAAAAQQQQQQQHIQPYRWRNLGWPDRNDFLERSVRELCDRIGLLPPGLTRAHSYLQHAATSARSTQLPSARSTQQPSARSTQLPSARSTQHGPFEGVISLDSEREGMPSVASSCSEDRGQWKCVQRALRVTGCSTIPQHLASC